MNLILQLVLVATLFAGLNCGGDLAQDPTANDSEVLEGSFYGIEITQDEPEAESEVTTRSSRRGGEGHRRHRHRGHHGHHGFRQNMTAAEKLEKICQTIQSTTPRSHARHMAEKLNRLDPEMKQQITTILTNRKAEMQQCCQLATTEREECAANLQQERYERVCNGEEPMCIWAAMKGITTPSSDAVLQRCCALEGADRVSCFETARAAYKRSRFSKKRN